jgi:thiamine transport system permease protein
LGLFLLSPYLIWLAKISEWRIPGAQEWMYPLLMASFQSALSAGFSLLVGFVLFLSVQGWKSLHIRKGMEILLLIPSTVPALFVALGMISIFSRAGRFPYGLGAVVLAHVVMNAGLVAVAFQSLVAARLGGIVEAAVLMGSSRLRFWREIGWPVLRSDIACLFLFVFGISFTSFSIPILLGGNLTLTLEAAIYNLIRIDGRWDAAVILAALQAAGLLLLAALLPRGFWPSGKVLRGGDFLAARSLRFLVFLPVSVACAGWTVGLISHGLAPWPKDLPVFEAFLTTFILGLSIGLIHLILFMITAYVMPHRRLVKFLNGYLAPSTVITGFAFLLLPGESVPTRLFLSALAISLISFPLLYRWMVHSSLMALERQVQAARLLGASWSMILFDVVWPQAALPILKASGLAALWGSGDFAVTSMVAGSVNTVPLLITSLIGNYRIESAELLLLPLLVTGFLLYGFFSGGARYVGG